MTHRTRLLSLLPAGVAITHALGYAVTGTDPGAIHGYLTAVWVLGGCALTGTLFGGTRSGDQRLLGRHAVKLTGGVTVTFVVMEILERVAAGVDPASALQPALVVGMVLAGAVATGLLLLTRVADRLRGALRAPAMLALPVASTPDSPVVASLRDRRPSAPTRRRGPPDRRV